MSSNHVPLPRSVWKAAVGTAFMIAMAAGSKESTDMWLGAGLVWWLGFLMILRPCEMMAAGRKSISMAQDFADTGGWISLCIDDPKTRLPFGFKQFAHVVDPLLGAWLGFYFRGYPKETYAKVFWG